MHLPSPTFLADFVIHYRGTSYHFHKFALCYHSTYFRNYIEPLTNGQRAYPTDECSEHAGILHCIRLPDRCGMMEADTDNIRLFLYHLYSAFRYNCLPYTVHRPVDLVAEPNHPFRVCDDVELLSQPPPFITCMPQLAKLGARFNQYREEWKKDPLLDKARCWRCCGKHSRRRTQCQLAAGYCAEMHCCR